MLDITTLKNGVRVVNEYMPDIESVSVNVWVKTGSGNETKKINGISHFLEHMAFKGTKTRNTQKIAEEFDDIGGRVNAFTSVATTVFYTKVLKENIDKAVELLSDIFQNSIFPEDEIEKERNVILQELAMTKDDPSDIIGDYFVNTSYQNQPYGRPIIGTEKNIKTFTRDDLINYQKDQYKTNDVVISFAGKISNRDALRLVNKYFTSLNVGKNKESKIAKYTGGYFSKNKKLEQTQLMIGFESCNYFDEHFYEACTLGVLMGGGMSSRLFQQIREKMGLCYSIYATNSSSKDTGMLDISCAVAPNKINDTIIAIIDELKRATSKITDEECQRAKIKLKSNILMGKESNSNRAQNNAIDIILRDKIIPVEEVIEKVDSVDIKKLEKYMECVLNKSKPTTAILGKIDDKTLTEEKISGLIVK